MRRWRYRTRKTLPDKADHRPTISHAMEDYLKAIYELLSSKSVVTTSQLAQRMKCTPASVTNMLQKLSSLRLVKYRPYKGVTLTAAGTRIALEVIRHHRLIELYLAEVLGYSWDKVHAEADALEHVISEEFEEQIDKALGRPSRDPHGAPIPRKEATALESHPDSLWDASEGAVVRVESVDDKDSERLRYLKSLGILPGVEVRISRRAPFNGPLFVSVGEVEHGLSEELARQIFVTSNT